MLITEERAKVSKRLVDAGVYNAQHAIEAALKNGRSYEDMDLIIDYWCEDGSDAAVLYWRLTNSEIKVENKAQQKTSADERWDQLCRETFKRRDEHARMEAEHVHTEPMDLKGMFCELQRKQVGS